LSQGANAKTGSKGGIGHGPRILVGGRGISAVGRADRHPFSADAVEGGVDGRWKTRIFVSQGEFERAGLRILEHLFDAFDGDLLDPGEAGSGVQSVRVIEWVVAPIDVWRPRTVPTALCVGQLVDEVHCGANSHALTISPGESPE
jgi:hypothetical protein